MEIQVNDIIIGKVDSVKPYALFMVFEDGSKGLLHISELSDDYIRDIEKFGTIGDEIKVKVLSIDPSNNFLRVSYKKVPEAERFSSHVDKINLTKIEGDFAPLEEKLPTWIEETLKLKKEGK